MATHAGLFVPRDTAGNGTSALDGRLALGGLTGTVQRCIAGGAITASGSNMQFTVAQAVFELADLDNTGAMMLTPFDTTVLPAIPAGPASGTRIDSIIVRQQIVGNSLGDTATTGLVQTVQGTPSTGTPANPTIPAGWYEYARITVPTNASTASACAVQVLYPATLAPATLASASLAALSFVAGTTVGQRAYGADGVEYRWNGTVWRPWTSSFANWTPTFTAMTASGGSHQWKYDEGQVLLRGYITAPAPTGQPTVSLPVASDGAYGSTMDGWAHSISAGGVYYPGFGFLSGAGFSWYAFQTLGSGAGATIGSNGISASSPFTWGASTQMNYRLRYTPA